MANTEKNHYLCGIEIGIMAESNFIDYVRIYCASGHGGAGSTHLYRAKYVPKGGPDGGDGGRGGHIILKANSQFWTLIHLKYRKNVKAEDGGKGEGGNRHGKNGADITLEVPLGTVVKDAETGEVIMELVEDGEEKILCPGGRGGLGNSNFKSPTMQTPRFAQPGEEGVEGCFILELKLLADVGLVGFPNAGKSTLLSTITSAKPKIANYAFTTLEPNLGIVRYYDDRSFVLADIPGIIEGAHEGRGIGIRFLRHIERNSVLLFMVSAEEEDIAKAYETLLNELREYNPELLVKDRVLAVTKCDLIDSKQEKKIQKQLPEGIPAVLISSLSQKGLKELKEMLWTALHKC
jgi:GTPase